MDVVFPRNNERKLVEMAARLGTRELMLCYPVTDDLRRRSEETERFATETVRTRFGVLVRTQNDVQRAKGLTKDIVARSRPWVYDDRRVRFVIDMEAGRRDDFTHHRNSGLNQVFIKKAMRHGKTLLVNASLLFGDRKELILGRMMQNNRFYRKYRPDVVVVSGASQPLEMRTEKDLRAILML